MNWMEEHAELIVEPLRNRRYQARVRAELMDHMGSLYQSCLEEGMSEAEARGETLSQLGSVRQLRREYRTVHVGPVHPDEKVRRWQGDRQSG